MPARLALAVVMTLLVPSCASLAAVTAGHIGCPEEEIEIFNDRSHWASRSWSARCRGRVYHCIGVSGGKYSAPHISCKGEPRRYTRLSPSGDRAPTTAGCQYDNQCKGDRICLNGRCTAPGARPSAGSTGARPTASPRPSAPARPAPVVLPSFAQRLGVELDDAAKHVAAMGLKAQRGAVVLSVRKGGAAHRRNIRRGDVVVGLATARVKSVADVVRLNRPLKAGQRFHIVIQRAGRIFSFYMQF
jgi:hypothetical protein